jgi:hypothetical protein
MLSFEFESFYHNWTMKAEGLSVETLQDCFDKFFTLYVIYNRLYAELTFLMARQGKLSFIHKTKTGEIKKIRAFPDSWAAKCYVNDYLGSNLLVSHIEQDKNTRLALQEICELINNERFYIKLDVLTGTTQREEDLKLLENLESTNKSFKAHAILDFIYSLRCNMFHGNKDFTRVQVPLLRPAIIIIDKISKLLYEKLSTNDEQNLFPTTNRQSQTF